jgi:hypothetical protein
LLLNPGTLALQLSLTHARTVSTDSTGKESGAEGVQDVLRFQYAMDDRVRSGLQRRSRRGAAMHDMT